MFSTLLRGVFFSEMNNGVACVRLPFDALFWFFSSKMFRFMEPAFAKNIKIQKSSFFFLFNRTIEIKTTV